MKKTLIALAALAATGTAFAQSSVTISGKFGVSGVKNEIGNKKAETNFGVTDGDVKFSGVEDIGGGLKADFGMEIRVRGRVGTKTDDNGGNGYGIGARNSTIGLSHTSFGKITAGAIEVANGIKARGWAGAPIGIANSLEGKNVNGNGTGGPLGSAYNSDILQYTSPELVKGLTVTAFRLDNISSPAASTTRGTTANALGVNYTDGPISAGADYTIFNKTTMTNLTKEATRIRVSGSYDLGVAVIGAGYEDFSDLAVAVNNKANYTAGVKVPLGAFTVGGVFAKSDAKKADASGFATKAYGLAAQYDFSKRTNVNYTFLKQSDSAVATYEGNRHQLRLMHSF